MSKWDRLGLAATLVFGAWCWQANMNDTPAPAKVELTPEVKYEIQKQVQRELRLLTKPVLPMVAPDKKVKVKK